MTEQKRFWAPDNMRFGILTPTPAEQIGISESDLRDRVRQLAPRKLIVSGNEHRIGGKDFLKRIQEAGTP